MSPLLIILLVLVVLSLGGGVWGGEYLGPGPVRRWSPLGILLVIVVILALTGRLHIGRW